MAADARREPSHLLLSLGGLASCGDLLTSSPSMQAPDGASLRSVAEDDIGDAAMVSGSDRVPGQANNALPHSGAQPWTAVALPTGERPVYLHVRTTGFTRAIERQEFRDATCYWLSGVCDRPAGDVIVGGGGVAGDGVESQLSVELRVRKADGRIVYPAYGPQGGQMEWLVLAEPGDRFETRQWGILGHRGTETVVVYAYNLDHSSLQVVANGVVPIAAVPSAAGPGDSVTYRLHTFDPRVTQVKWYWGDRWNFLRLDHCKQTCTVPAGGWIQVDGYWGNTFAGPSLWTRRDSVKAPTPDGCPEPQPGGPSFVCGERPPPTLQLTCRSESGESIGDETVALTINVVRGGRLDCDVSTRDGPPPTGASWTFLIGDRVTIPQPGIDLPQEGLSWGGIMAAYGTIQVSAHIGAEAAVKTLFGTVRITNRTNFRMPPYPSGLPAETFTTDEFDPLPVVQVTGGQLWGEGQRGRYEYGVDWATGIDEIGSGPNLGVHYFKSPPQWYTPEVFIHAALSPGHPFYGFQTGPKPGDDPLQRWCTQSDMARILREVRRHEGSVDSPTLSHHEFISDYVAAHDPSAAMEKFTVWVPSNTVDRGGKVAPALRASNYLAELWAANIAAVHATSNTVDPPCLVHFP
jgi:hypothetical protein